MNCRGLSSNFYWNHLSSCLLSSRIAFFSKSDDITLRHSSVYSTYVDKDEQAADGSRTFARDNILHSYLCLETDLQAGAGHIYLDKTITMCSVYIPLNSSLSLSEI
jgi:hypothetical protein